MSFLAYRTGSHGSRHDFPSGRPGRTLRFIDEIFLLMLQTENKIFVKLFATSEDLYSSLLLASFLRPNEVEIVVVGRLIYRYQL